MTQKKEYPALDAQPVVLYVKEELDSTMSFPLLAGPRVQTPTGSAIQVQIGPGDSISNLPVIIDYDHHQVHEGETWRGQNVLSTLGAGTVKFALVVPTYGTLIFSPHIIITADIYGGNATINIYEGATYTGGAEITVFNRNRNIEGSPGMKVYGSVTSTTGTLVETFFVGVGRDAVSSSRSQSELILKSGTTYRVDIIGRAVGTEAVVAFNWYEDLGV